MKVYFGYRSLLLNITDEKSEALVFKPIKTYSMGWWAETTDLKPGTVLNWKPSW